MLAEKLCPKQATSRAGPCATILPWFEGYQEEGGTLQVCPTQDASYSAAFWKQSAWDGRSRLERSRQCLKSTFCGNLNSWRHQMTENIRSRILAESLIVRCIEWHDAEKKQLWYVEAAILKYCHRNLLEGRRQMPMPDFDYIAHFEQVITGQELQRHRGQGTRQRRHYRR